MAYFLRYQTVTKAPSIVSFTSLARFAIRTWISFWQSASVWNARSNSIALSRHFREFARNGGHPIPAGESINWASQERSLFGAPHFRSRPRARFFRFAARREALNEHVTRWTSSRCFVLIGFMRFTCTGRWISACTRGALDALHIPFHSVSRYPICTRAALSTENSISRGLLIVDEFKRESYGLWRRWFFATSRAIVGGLFSHTVSIKNLLFVHFGKIMDGEQSTHFLQRCSRKKKSHNLVIFRLYYFNNIIPI